MAAPLDSSNRGRTPRPLPRDGRDAAQNLAAAVTKAREQAVEKDSEAPACLLDATAAQVLLGSGLVQAAATNLAGALDHLEKMLYAQLRDACRQGAHAARLSKATWCRMSANCSNRATGRRRSLML